jgi:hypothetical protein
MVSNKNFEREKENDLSEDSDADPSQRIINFIASQS